MKYTADYILPGSIDLLFNTYAFKKFSEKRGIELDDLYTEIEAKRGFKLDTLVELITAAHESYCRYNSIEMVATELDFYECIDKAGGLKSKQVTDIFVVYVSKIMNIDLSLLKATVEEVEDEQKKSMKSTPGDGSTSKRQKQA